MGVVKTIGSGKKKNSLIEKNADTRKQNLKQITTHDS